MKLSTTVKAEALAIALFKLTGRRPVIEDLGGRARLSWSAEDLPFVRTWFESQLSRPVTAVPPDVEIDFLPVVGPYAARSAAPAVLLTLAAGVLLGRLL